jgi:hypothetical protein
MPKNNNQPDINKAIDVCMEEYKTLRTEILQTIQNRTNVIVFGGGLVLTLLGIGISPIANLPIMKETTTITSTNDKQHTRQYLIQKGIVVTKLNKKIQSQLQKGIVVTKLNQKIQSQLPRRQLLKKKTQ